MADTIKKFFEKKKAETRFKKAGPGHTLSGPSSKVSQESPSTSSATSTSLIQRATPSAESKQAAAAALARLGGEKKDSSSFNTLVSICF